MRGAERNLKYLKTSREDFEFMQSNIRNHINELSRPYLRDLFILDLPNELLLQVFSDFEYPFSPGPLCRTWNFMFGWGRVRDISNIRLACRRFHNLVSRQLIPIVRVGVDDESLARLEKISHHPIFANSVRLVSIVPQFYNSAFADFNRFISHYAAQLRIEADHFESGAIAYQDVGGSVITELVSDARTVASTLERFTLPDHSNGGEMEQYQTQLDEIYREYVARINNQEELMTSGRFSRVVASAMTRMPGTRDLKFGSHVDYCPRILSPGNIVWDAVFKFMRWPVYGTQVQRDGLELPGYKCLVQLMSTLRHTGISLNGLAIDLSPIRTPGSFVLSPYIRKELSLSTQHLLNFQFTVQCFSQPAGLDHTHGGDLNDFLSACLDTSSLQDVCLSTICYSGAGSAEAIDLGKVMGSRSREKLTRVVLGGSSAVDLSQLTAFLDALPESMTQLQLARIRLRSGTWKQVLDKLRKRKYHVKEGIVRSPEGAECNFMSDRDVDKLFGTPYSDQPPSEVDRYILGQDAQQRSSL